MQKIILFSIILLALLACGSSSEKGSESDNSMSGSRIYTLYCTQCHGAKGNLELNGATDFNKSELTLEERIDVITNGRKTMLPYKDQLTKAQIKAVAKYTQKFN